jgi:hypothetical protein
MNGALSWLRLRFDPRVNEGRPTIRWLIALVVRWFVFTLGDYVNAGIMSDVQAELLRVAVCERRNILVAGGTSTGKTTLVNALLAEVAKTGDRVVLIEDTRELQCAAPNLVALRTKETAPRRFPTWRAPTCGYGLTVFRSARRVAPRRSTFSKPGADSIPAMESGFDGNPSPRWSKTCDIPFQVGGMLTAGNPWASSRGRALALKFKSPLPYRPCRATTAGCFSRAARSDVECD